MNVVKKLDSINRHAQKVWYELAYISQIANELIESKECPTEITDRIIQTNARAGIQIDDMIDYLRTMPEQEHGPLDTQDHGTVIIGI